MSGVRVPPLASQHPRIPTRAQHRDGLVAITFAAPAAGTFTISWFELPRGAVLTKAKPKPILVASGRASVSGPGKAKAKLKLTAAGKCLVKRSRSLKLTAQATFIPSGKPPVKATRTFTLHR